ncbi:HTH-type transcriptional regulator PuuR [Microbulbifer aestuariivivens]|uniref:HTH-type transcriptional regulator PuuR n=1 Tax=Microbulbifer aestuariivivens TaxID=1908308 RepID=A0ABP9WQW0_9GAMM
MMAGREFIPQSAGGGPDKAIREAGETVETVESRGDRSGGGPPCDSGSEVGVRLKALRRLYGWSQRHLAERSGVTHATISLIEQGRVSPSIDSLKKVLDGIPLSLAEFFTLKFVADRPVFFRTAEMPAVDAAGAVSRLLGAFAGAEEPGGLTMRYTVIAPGSCSEPDLRAAAGEEGGIIISGHLEVTVGSEVALLGPGDGYLFARHRPHRFRNPCEVECVLVSASCPGVP